MYRNMVVPLDGSRLAEVILPHVDETVIVRPDGALSSIGSPGKTADLGETSGEMS